MCNVVSVGFFPVDLNGFEELARTHYARLYAAAVRLCRETALAHDLVQDTFERALRNMAQLRRADAINWLMTTLQNRFIDHYRSRARHREEPLEGAEEVAEEKHTATPVESITSEDLMEAIDQLEEEFRLVYRLHGLEQRSYKEISRHLGIPVATVGSRLTRARVKLSALLQERVAQAA